MAKKPQTLAIAPLSAGQNLEKFMRDVEKRFPEAHDFSTCFPSSTINAHLGCTACLVNEAYFNTKEPNPLSDSDREMLRRLNSITANCREDMHEPDEQNVSADVVGTHLDNAMGSCKPPRNCGEFQVVIRNTSGDSARSHKTEYFNLASLIALARKAK